MCFSSLAADQHTAIAGSYRQGCAELDARTARQPASPVLAVMFRQYCPRPADTRAAEAFNHGVRGSAHLGGLLHVGGVELGGQGQLVHGLELGFVKAAGDALVVQAHLHQAAVLQPLLHSAGAAYRLLDPVKIIGCAQAAGGCSSQRVCGCVSARAVQSFWEVSYDDHRTVHPGCCSAASSALCTSSTQAGDP